MTTFERVRRNIRRDMDAIRVHTPESWAHILLTNTGRLTDEREQEKFWTWMTNPDELEHLPETVCEGMKHMEISTPACVTVPMIISDDDEKEVHMDVEIQNTYTRNGTAMFITSRPRPPTSEPLSDHPGSVASHSDEQIVAETS